jgi:hypothetical protein
MQTMIRWENKRGQITIFIVVAILVIAAAALLYLFAPGVKTIISDQPENPEEFIKTCLEDEVQDKIEIISLQGGVENPDDPKVKYFLNEGFKVRYLCYSNFFTEQNPTFEAETDTCMPQYGDLFTEIEKEIENSLEERVDYCFNVALKNSYEEQGYEVQIKQGEIDLSYLFDQVTINLPGYEALMTKEGVEKHDEFNIVVNNNLFELLSVANVILKGEVEEGQFLCSSIEDLSMNPHFIDCINIEFGDGTTIFALVNSKTDEIFQFASRSRVLR